MLATAVMKGLVGRLVLAVLLVGGCSVSGPHRARSMEQTLTAAGFRTLPADTAEKLLRLQSIPARELHAVRRDGKRYYVFPDPAGCKCAYVGDEAAYQRLDELNVEREVQDSERAARKADSRAPAIDAMNDHMSVEAIQRVYDPDTVW